MTAYNRLVIWINRIVKFYTLSGVDNLIANARYGHDHRLNKRFINFSAHTMHMRT